MNALNITHTHGITDTAYKMLMKGERKPSGPWMVSDRCGMSYLWSAEKNKDESDDVLQYIIEQAKESAMIQCPIFEDEVFHVLLLSIPEDEVQEDLSCENMERVADCIMENELKGYIVGVKSYSLSKYFHPLIIHGLLNNEHFSACNYPDILIEVSKCLGDFDYEIIQDNIKEL